MKTLKSFSNLAEAGFAHSLLESAGLHPFLADEQTGGSYSPIAILGMRLQVEESEYEHAQRVLAEGLDAEPPSGGNEPNSWAAMATDPHASGRIPWAVFGSVIVGFIVLCYAGANMVRERKRAGPTASTGDYVSSGDSNQDGKADHFATYRNRKLIHAESDRDFDGRIDEWLIYGSDGLLTLWETDENHDGKPDQFTSYRNGKRIHVESDRNFDGKLDEWEFYGPGGTRERVEYDENYDGKPDYFTVYRDGKVDRVESDRNFDGKLDEWDFYGSDGLPERSEYDENFDGKPDAWHEYRNRERVAMKEDADFNGSPDLFSTFKDGVLVQTDIRPDDSPIVTRRQFFTHTILREEWVDEDADGKFDYRIEFDPFGKPSEHLPIAGK